MITALRATIARHLPWAAPTPRQSTLDMAALAARWLRDSAAARAFPPPAQQRRNRLVHAVYLLRGDFPPQVTFTMRHFADAQHALGTICGTVGCAISFGPYAGLAKHPQEDWHTYGQRVFGLEDFPTLGGAFDWCFAPCWEDTDRTPQGAGQRLLWLERFGVPADCREQIWGKAPLCYAHLTLDDAEAALAALDRDTTRQTAAPSVRV